MAKARDELPVRMTVEDFLRWADDHPEHPANELIDGIPVAMAPARLIHSRLKARVWLALHEAIRANDLQCEALIDGIGLQIDDHTLYQPDAVVYCGDRLADEAQLVPDPVIVVEVLSPSTQHIDAGGKLEGYFRKPTVRHYLIVNPLRSVVIHHHRGNDARIETRIVHDGELELDPPGIGLDIDRLFG